MKNCFLTIFIFCSVQLLAQEMKNPVANPKAIIQQGDVRFTVLTPGLIRCEWDSTGKFTDQASLLIINRNLPVPGFKLKQTKKRIEILTEKLKLTYLTGRGKFTGKNLQIELLPATMANGILKGNGKNERFQNVWIPGTKNSGNLKGTYRTLDGYDGKIRLWNNDTMKLGDGLISRDGWHLLDDSERFLFDNSDWPWVVPRNSWSAQDWYFFSYGTNYKQALKDFISVAGRIPMPPKWAFGYWWSRYWSYTDQELRDLVANMELFDIPLDVLVIDMDWHITNPPGIDKNKKEDEFGEEIGWTGFTWNTNLFPDPGKFLNWTEEKKLKVTMNLHPASGVAPWEERYGEFAKAMNFDTTGKHNVPFEIADKKFAETYFNILLRPLEKLGVDFWWIDWQQWPSSKKYPTLSNTWWLNYCHFTDMERKGTSRPMLYHRWGGIGNHRYQIGFSGDTYISWNSLAYQPYFTATASNMGYGYWSHDIGGHMLRKGMTEMIPELTTRWIQFGLFSPILRTHSTKNALIYKEPWLYPSEYFKAIHDAIHLRYELFPYIYTSARQTYDSGISLCRPMYYDYPEKQEAYDYKNQYMFGENLLICPVIHPAANGRQTTPVSVWLPKGSWYEWFTGTMLEGGKIYERNFLINEIPVYVKAGSVMPGYPKIRNLQDNVNELVITVFPGESNRFNLYEDDGTTSGYTKEEYAFTKIETEKSPGTTMIKIQPREGRYSGMTDERSYEIRLLGSSVPEEVIVNGIRYFYNEKKKPLSWTYSAEDMTTHIFIPETLCAKPVNVSVKYPMSDISDEFLNGKIGQFRRVALAVKDLKFAGAWSIPDLLSNIEQTPIRIQYKPETLFQEIKQFDANIKKIPELLKNWDFDEAYKNKVLELVAF